MALSLSITILLSRSGRSAISAPGPYGKCLFYVVLRSRPFDVQTWRLEFLCFVGRVRGGAGSIPQPWGEAQWQCGRMVWTMQPCAQPFQGLAEVKQRRPAGKGR